jgi:hypothetical protein
MAVDFFLVKVVLQGVLRPYLEGVYGDGLPLY